ncbi:MAG: hypothetical protein ACXWYR_11145 [Solirubrobacterales bacterium]
MTAKVGAQVGIVSATTSPRLTASGVVRLKVVVEPKKGARFSRGLWRISL